MTRFQIIVLSIFGGFLLIGIIVFSSSRGGGVGPEDNVLIWGTIPEQIINAAVKDHPVLGTRKGLVVTYVEKEPADFNQEFIEALAEGRGPDIVILPHVDLWEHRNKIYPIPYSSFSERKFKDTFVEEGELYLTEEGILGLPLTIDPLVMYWNRDTFSNAGISKAPEYWDEFYTLSELLTKKDQSLNIIESAVALGEYRNVANAKGLLSALMMQAGNPITARRDGKILSVLNERFDQPILPAEAAVNFYTEFSNPIKLFYSWNRSLPRSDSLFTSGDLAIYFGFASELSLLRNKNPNINFDVAPLPQAREADTRITYGNMYALVVLKTAKSIPTAFKAAFSFTEPSVVSTVSSLMFLPPVRRDLLAARPADAYASVFYQSALRSRGWMDPDSSKTGAIFQAMIESITGGRTSTSEAVVRAHAEVDQLFRTE